MKRLTLIFTIILLNVLFGSAHASFVRINQVGYLEKDTKSAVVGSSKNLQGQDFFVKDLDRNRIVFSGDIGPPVSGVDGQSPFLFNHIIDFSPIETPGSYRIELEDKTISPVFEIQDNVYEHIIDSLLYFLRVARCGDTDPELHEPCHLYDATNTDLNLTGGWHDAGDFLKFTRSESYVTYTLLLAYELNKDSYSKSLSDLNHNGFADVLDEAKIGLDYLVKVYPDEKTFVYRVGDSADHLQGVRMPEDDRLAPTNRPALVGFHRNELSQYAFTMALASAVFKDFPQYTKEAENYLELAKKAYFEAKRVGTGHFDKLCLAATELYGSTLELEYLADAKMFNDKLPSGYWGNWSDNTILAHARLGRFYRKAVDKLRDSVASFYQASHNHLFGYDVAYAWSGLYVAITSASAGWFYKLLTNDDTYADLPSRVRDYILGINPWGVCFISGLGTNYPKNIHSRVAAYLKRAGVLKHGTIVGAIPGGPVKPTEWEAKWNHLVPKGEDIYAAFQTAECVYYDHFMAYPTNEPCIYGSSEAILFFSFYLRYLSSPKP